jgi:DUF4097 and DUF4098 domain-containing protein YvlB
MWAVEALMAYRRQGGSLFTGILLILFGGFFLAARLYPDLELGHIAYRYWPVILIIWGLTLLLERTAARRTGDVRTPGLRGGEVLLLLVMLMLAAAFIGWSALRHRAADWGISKSWMSKNASASQELQAANVPMGSRIQIYTPSGDITVHAASSNDLRVVAKITEYAWDEHEAQRKLPQINVSLTQQADGYKIQPSLGSQSRGDARVDLDVEVPMDVVVTAQSGSGDVTVSDVNGNVSITTYNGDTELHNITGDVDITSRHGDTSVTSATGDVRLNGTGGEVELTDVGGNATIQGEFYGPIRLKNVGKTTHFTSSRTDLVAEQLTGHMETDSDSIEIADTAGAVKLVTREKDVTLENIGGRIDLNDKHGDVDVRLSDAPHNPISLMNESGDISLALPEDSSFIINAASHSGDIDSEFEGRSLNLEKTEHNGNLSGSYGKDPKIPINLDTSYGTISLHKSM